MAEDDDDLMSLLRTRRRRSRTETATSAPRQVEEPAARPAAIQAAETEPARAAPAPPPDLQDPVTVLASTDDADPEEDSDPLFSRMSSRRRAIPTPAAPVDDVPDASVGVDRLLTPGLERGVLARMAEVSEVQRWEAIKQHLTAAGPDIRWRAVGWVLQQEVAHARKVVDEVRRPRRGRPAEPRRADMIEGAVEQFTRTVESLERALSLVLPDMSVLTAATNALDRARVNLEHARRGVQAVVGGSSWAAGWEGCAQGRGVPGYDTPEGVARALSAQRRAHERWKAQRPARSSVLTDADALTPRPRGQLSSEPTLLGTGQVT